MQTPGGEAGGGEMGGGMLWKQNPMTSALKRHMRRHVDTLLPQKRSTYKLFRDTSIVDAMVFGAYFTLFLSISYMAFDVHTAFTTDDAVIDLFLDEEFDGQVYKANFYEVMTQEEFWIWMRGPFVNGLYPDAWYNDDPFTRTQLGYLDYHLRLVGGAQIRQLRVRNDSCFERRFVENTAVHGNLTLGKYDSKDGTCFSAWSSLAADTQPFGPPSAPTRYTHSTDLSDLNGHHDFGLPYGTGGYVVTLPSDAATGRALVEQLFKDRWTDRGTRAVSLSFNLYNTNTRLLTVTRILFEFFPTGHMWKSAKTYTIKMAQYSALTDGVRAAMEAFYICFLLYYIFRQFNEIRWMRRRVEFFYKFGNLYDLVLIGANAMLIFKWVSYVITAESFTFDVNAEEFTDFFAMAETFILTFTWAAAVGLLGFLKIFQFLGISKTMSALWMTLARAAPDLATFLVGFLLVSAGFAYTATLLFGPYLMEYHKLAASFNTLLRVPLGDMDYAALAQARPALAPVFFTLYVTMVALIILNMFIGIITKYFTDVHTEIKSQDFWKRSTLSFEGEVLTSARTYWLYCSRRTVCRRRRSRMDDDELHRHLARHLARRARSREFMEALQHAVRMAKRTNNIILYEYFERLYRESDQANLYICVNELCGLIRDKPCSSHTKCEARAVHDTYMAMNLVMLVGNNTKKFVPLTAEQAVTFQTFDVLKFSSSGVAEPRILSINTDRGQLLNFSRSMRLRYKLPMKQLITAELDNKDPRRLILMFSSSGVDAETEKRIGRTLNIMMDVLFDDALNRQVFLTRLLEAHAIVNDKPSEAGTAVLEDLGYDTGTSSARRQGERASLAKVLVSQSSSRKSLLDTTPEGSKTKPNPAAGPRPGAGGAGDEAAGGVVAAAMSPNSKQLQRAKDIEHLRQEARTLTNKLGQVAVQRDLNLNASELATLAGLQQELARARRHLRQMEGRRRSSIGIVNAAAIRAGRLLSPMAGMAIMGAGAGHSPSGAGGSAPGR